MNYSKLFSIFVVIALELYGLVGFYFLPLASFEGDLTRMAKLSDIQFLRTKIQPAVNPELLKQANWEDADVLAIGDSFTTLGIWQTVFEKQGIHIRTESWSSMFNICGDISDWIRDKGFRGKYIIIENAEKYHEIRLADSVKCIQTRYHPLPPVSVHPPKILPDENTSNYSGSMSIGIITALNTYKYKKLSSKPDFLDWNELDDAKVVRIKNGCKIFSHLSCNDVLFFKEDRVQDLGNNVLENMQVINDRLKSFTLVWVVIPDKATVYLPTDKKFWDEAEHRFLAPNILREFRQAIQNNTIDLYLANDTHVTTTGFLLLGTLIYDNIYNRENVH